jgi:hypothetical protein
MAGFRLVAAIGALIAALMLSVPASASAPLTGTGTGTIVGMPVITSTRDAGGNTIQERSLSGTVSGALQGTFVENVRGVIHPNGTVTFQGTMTFTGTVPGCGTGTGTGTLTLGVTGTGVTGLPVTESKVRVIGSSTNTIPAHGVGTVNQNGPSLTYEIQYQC